MGKEQDTARDRILGGGTSAGVSPAIHASWLRARSSGVRPDATLPPVPLVDEAIVRHRREHPLAAVWPTLRESLRWATADTGQLLIVGDAEGHLLWCQGDRDPLRHAERVNMTPGSLWSEKAVGTTGVGTAIALRRPIQVIGAEHYVSWARSFACTAAPIHDPVTGDLLGVIDLTSAVGVDAALRLSLVTTTAKLAETQLHAERLQQQARLREKYADRLTRRLGAQGAIIAADGSVLHAGPDRWLPNRVAGLTGEGPVVLPDGRHAVAESLGAGRYFLLIAQDGECGATTLRFEGLGRARAVVRVGNLTHELRGRHSEILALLIADPVGMSAEELAREVYGSAGRAGSVRAEMSRLRQVLGHRLGSDPYRVTGETWADFLQPGACPRALLPKSKAPGVAALRGGPLHDPDDPHDPDDATDDGADAPADAAGWTAADGPLGWADLDDLDGAAHDFGRHPA
ncbi:GAF domain-containing protein [Yinghuangia seranimata]|uniref:GAF domain-containing protein n=1 Tax=Yinghuangia seranimata TaxID=408067 RepID=UPI00248C6AAA|nr:GAF domain-containing protein [Yinghuangia seranimata]MDI2132067.1 GAF domain-containing protein [Yinghuangia seranimata]